MIELLFGKKHDLNSNFWTQNICTILVSEHYTFDIKQFYIEKDWFNQKEAVHSIHQKLMLR